LGRCRKHKRIVATTRSTLGWYYKNKKTPYVSIGVELITIKETKKTVFKFWRNFNRSRWGWLGVFVFTENTGLSRTGVSLSQVYLFSICH
jgi:hypothetical protein